MRSDRKRLLIAALSLWMSLTALHAANVVTVKGAQGAPGDEATISVTLKTDAADVAAAEIRVPLPEGVEPVAGSVALNGSRVPDHSVTADMNGRDYVIVLFNTSLKSIPAGDGELLTFKVTLGDNPGHFALSPRVKLSGNRGSAIAAEASGGTLSVLAPRLELGSLNVDFGRVALRSEVVRQVEVRNSGTTTLTFSDYTTGVEGLTATMPQSLAEGESAWIELHYSPTVRSAAIDGRFTPVSDGVGRSQFVRIQAVPFSVNELRVGSAEGISDEEVTVSVNMNNMEPITGADFTIPLPDELEFVAGSVVKGARASALSVESTVGADRSLRIVMFGLSNKAVEGDDGELLSFRLKLKGRSGYYTLMPSKTILANAAGENMTSQVYAGAVQISSPHLSASSDWAIGNVPLSGANKFTFPLRNDASVPLTIEKVVFLDDIAECSNSFPMVISPYEQKEITMSVKKPQFGAFATTMNIYTNDPDNRMKSVKVSGNFYSPNEMSFAGRYSDGKFLIDASLTNEEAIAAMQLDVVCPDGVSISESLLTLSDRAASHSATLAKVGSNRYRVVIFSLKNAPFAGNEGIVFSLGLEGSVSGGKQIRVENIKLSSVDGVNITTPNTDIKFGELPTPVEKIVMSTQTLTLMVGESAVLTVTIVPDNATEKSVQWSVVDPTVASIADGKVTALALGSTTVKVTAADGSGAAAECTVNVVPTPAASITLNSSELSLKATETFKLEATVSPETTTDKTIAWTSSNETVATVDANGNVTAIALGNAVITASCGSVSATCNVTVVPTSAGSITLDKTTAELKATETVQLTATVLPETTTDKTVTWTSSNNAVATVDQTGKVTAIAVGKANITATAASGVSATCEVTVVPTPAATVTLNRSELSLKATETFKLEAAVSPETTTDKTIAWTSSNETVATVDANGNVTAIAVGNAVITATCGSVSATCNVTVEPMRAETVKLSEHRLNLHEGAMVELTAEVLPADATDKDVVWSSSDETVATVSQDGIVTGIAKGTATIRVALALDAGVYDECVVNVDKFLSGIEEMTDGGDEIDYAAAYEVYSLSGAWLGNSIDSLAPGFYIIRQGGRTAKLMKN